MLLLKQKPALSSKYQYEISINWSRWHHLESQCKIARHQWKCWKRDVSFSSTTCYNSCCGWIKFGTRVWGDCVFCKFTTFFESEIWVEDLGKLKRKKFLENVGHCKTQTSITKFSQRLLLKNKLLQKHYKKELIYLLYSHNL